MVIVILESLVVMLTTLFVCSQAFWWSSPTTEQTPTVKQIPVGYFRTYTYQPLSYPPSYSNYPYGGSHHSFTAGSGPFGSWSQRQTFSNNPPPPPTPGLSALKLTAPPPPPAPVTTQPPPPPPPPQPTQPPTQSPPPQYIHINPSNSQSQSTPVQPQPYSNIPIVEAHPPPQSSQSSPTSQPHQSFINSGYSSSPHYYQSSNQQDPPQNYHHYYMSSGSLPLQQQIQFVPCMCPVSISVSSEFPENRSDNLIEDEPTLLERNDQNLKEETH